ncbi:MAG: ABC transporter permease [Methylomonas sp.]|jgi:NitT/TauT family transport system permease protein|uniref:ABC transporter permease n=1 Tax=Methylomonas sp. TaxID=418 RepID=UPI0025E71B66|nr:ABC transporter permease [Methylomonas sp.]MCK9607396.1 ABC transporter permease [Methylomonas sp.]
MKRIINRNPNARVQVLLSLLPFVAVAVIYVFASEARLAENANDKLLPSLDAMFKSLTRLTTVPNKRTGDILLWTDTAASLTRLSWGVSISALLGLFFGILTGAIPYTRSLLSSFIAVLSMIPPMAILPILFIMFDLGELSKVILIVIGIAPFIIRDLQQQVLEIPREQIIKAQTLGASTWQIIARVLLPQLYPRLIQSVRLSLGTAWLFLIAAEAIAATDGLGYRIFLVRRYLAMDVILPYVAWITLLAYLSDTVLLKLSQHISPWFHGTQRKDASA